MFAQTNRHLLLPRSSSMIEKVKAVVQETFPNAILDEQFDERLMYKVPQTDVTSLALIFEILEKGKIVFVLHKAVTE